MNKTSRKQRGNAKIRRGGAPAAPTWFWNHEKAQQQIGRGLPF